MKKFRELFEKSTVDYPLPKEDLILDVQHIGNRIQIDYTKRELEQFLHKFRMGNSRKKLHIYLGD